MPTQRQRDFGQYLARLRGERSQRQQADLLCDLSGKATLTRHEVSRWERGERIPDDWLPYIARASEVPLSVVEAKAAHARGKTPTPPVDLSPFFPQAEALKARIASALHTRRVTSATAAPLLVLVGGYAGSGKTEFARFLSDLTGWAVLDKDAMTRRMTERLLISLGGDPHDRHTDLYQDEIRPHEYRCLMNSTYANVDANISMIVSAPFATELHAPGWLDRLTHRCKARGVDVAAIWINSDNDTMHDYIETRDAPRDAWKLNHWDEYTSTLQPDPPPGITTMIDNRHGAAVSLADQTRTALHKLTP
ncbi:AAA family ATPase [Actinomadura oligospora]|uniref:AAA family ATPase n=1 Tax=Actinomadura oligospora TaxID=111804 RepID=UPI000A078C4A|nr:AAA family ATPase [Actinomadura oligospora]